MSIGDEAPGFSLPDTDGVEHGRGGRDGRRVHLQPLPLRARLARRLIAGGARLRPGRASSPSTPTTPSATRRDSFEAMKQRVAADGGWPHPYLRDEIAGGRAGPTGPRPRPTCSCSTPRPPALPRRAGRRPPRRGSAAWLRAALDAVLAGEEPDPAGDRPGRLQRQVEAVIAATAAAVSLKSSR